MTRIFNNANDIHNYETRRNELATINSLENTAEKTARLITFINREEAIARPGAATTTLLLDAARRDLHALTTDIPPLSDLEMPSSAFYGR